jgi:ABC-type lipopolysaccharide export system ATPase subunit
MATNLASPGHCDSVNPPIPHWPRPDDQPGLSDHGRALRGLAPIVIQGVWEAIGKLKEKGLSILLVEQNASLALKLVDYVHVLSKGKVVYSAPPQELWTNDEIKSRFLGM